MVPKRQLKVFRTHLGFYDTIVAAPSQKAALAAWGVHQNLFHEGMASITTDSDMRKAALDRPGTVLARMFGSRDAFTVSKPTPQAKHLPKESKPRKATKGREVKSSKPSTKRVPDREAIEAARAHLKQVEREQIRKLARLTEQQRELAREVSESKRSFDRELRAARTALEAARKKRITILG